MAELVALVTAGAATAVEGRTTDDAIPQTIGRYALEAELGRGAMGVVWEAHDPELDRRVALKLHGLHALQDDGWARARKEARALARLEHVNVVRVYDVIPHRGQLAVAMELVRGQTLRAWVRAERRGWRDVVQRFVPAAKGLAAVHEAGLVHRDFKPDNVICSDDGRVVLVDFGLAGEQHGVASASAVTKSLLSTATEQLTAEGMLVGTPAYMSPQQHLGEPADAASDQFAFCVSLWEALFGERPFAGDSSLELARNASAGRFREESAERESLPRSLTSLLRRGLRPEPAERHASMRALVLELEAVAAATSDEHGVDVGATPSRAGRRMWGPMLGAAAVALVWGGWGRFAGKPAVRSPARATVVEVISARFASDSGQRDVRPTAAVPSANVLSSAAPAAAAMAATPKPRKAPAGTASVSPAGSAQPTKRSEGLALLERAIERYTPEQRRKDVVEPLAKADGLRASGDCAQALRWYQHAHNGAVFWFGESSPLAKRAQSGMAACKAAAPPKPAASAAR